MFYRRYFILATLFTTLFTTLFWLTGCSLIQSPPPPPGMPPPIPSAVPWDVSQLEARGLVVDPASDVTPKTDPAITGLMGAVSQQQLIGYVQALESFGTRSVFSTIEEPDFGIGAARQWIYNEFVRVGNGRLHVEFQEFPLHYQGLFVSPMNVVATLPGTAATNEAIVLMAHYDNRPPDSLDGESFAPGANDNASGVALLLESARLLSAREWNQTIIFVATAAEEQGTYGSRHFVQKAYLEGMDIVAAVNYDAVGGREGIPQYVRLFAANLLQSPSGELGRYYEYIAGLYLPTFPVRVINGLDRDGRWGDHREFVNAGMPAIRLIESEENPDLVNSKLDTWNRVDYDYLQKITQLNVVVVANLAGAPLTPPIPLISVMDSSGTYQLRWPVDDTAAGYAIAFRPIASESYPPFRFVRASEAGNVALTGLDPNAVYGVSLTALDEHGRLSDFSPEVIVDPGR